MDRGLVILPFILIKNQRGVGQMKQVLDILKRTDAEDRIRVLRLEIDYELLTLHDAMIAEDIVTINETKYRLQQLSQELMRLEA